MSIPSCDELRSLAHSVSLAMTTPFRGITHREALIFDAPDGPAEWSPFLEYDDAEAATWLSCALEQGFGQDRVPEVATLEGTIRVNGTLPALPAAEVAGFLDALGMPTTVKVKVAGPESHRADDVQRVRAVREALGPTGRIRLDANAAWGVDEAEHAIREMEPFDIDYVEQPVESVADMAVLRARITRLGIGVAADESIRRTSDIAAVIAAGACDVVVVKVQPLGGIAPALRVIEQARAAGLEVVLSSALETSLGVHYGARLQLWLGATATPLDAGLGTASLFHSDVLTTPLIPHGGQLRVSTPELDYAALRTNAMTEDRREWWFARLERCLALV